MSRRDFPKVCGLIRRQRDWLAESKLGAPTARIVNGKKPKTLIGFRQNGMQSSCLPTPCRHTDHTTVGVEAGAKSSLMLFERNMVNPTSRLLEAGDSARSAVGVAGRG